MLSKLEPHRALMLKAAIALQDQGWCQGTARSPDGRRCILAALRDGVSDADVYNKARDDLEAFLGMSPDHWNDQRGRTAAEVIGALEAAASA